MNCIALIVAGGSGLRLGHDLPKQYVKILGKTILEYTLDKFLSVEAINAIKIVIAKGHEEMYQAFKKSPKVLPYVLGGGTRQESVKNGLVSLQNLNPKKVLIHDAARPFVSEDVINSVIQKLEDYKAVDVGIDLIDTITVKPKFGAKILNRDELYGTQTPQGFIFKEILDLHLKNKNIFSDDIALAMETGIDIGFVKGEPINFKITNKIDLQFAEMLISNKLV